MSDEELEIKKAKDLLYSKGYSVIKLTHEQMMDMEECLSGSCDKDCGTCSCNVCVINEP